MHIYFWYHGENKLPFEKGLCRHYDLINHSENICHKCIVCRYSNCALFSSFLFVWWTWRYSNVLFLQRW